MNLINRATELLKKKFDRDGYIPVGIKCCKVGDREKVYADLAYRLLEDLLWSYAGKEKLL